MTAAIILAGGKGTRLAGLHPNCPKPLIPVAGQPFLYWVTRWLVHQGFRHFVYSTGHLATMIEDWCQATNDFAPDVTRQCQLERTPLGTGGGIVNCLPCCEDETILATNGDSILLFDLAPALQALREADAVMVGVWQPDSSRSGAMKIGADGMLESFMEKGSSAAGYINAGLYLFRRTLLDSFPRGANLSMEYDVIPALLKQGKRIAVHTIADAPFIDIGLPETLSQADAFIERNKRWF